jgi:hypothetical protein
MSELESPFIHTEQGKDATTEQLTNSINILQRKVLLLTNRLNYELFLKQQYTRHIGRLHRDRLMDNVIEADRQGLVSYEWNTFIYSYLTAYSIIHVVHLKKKFVKQKKLMNVNVLKQLI